MPLHNLYIGCTILKINYTIVLLCYVPALEYRRLASAGPFLFRESVFTVGDLSVRFAVARLSLGRNRVK